MRPALLDAAVAKQQLEFEATVSAAQLNKLLQDLRTGGEDAAKALNDALGGTVKKTVLLETREDATGARNLVAVEKERLTIADRIVRAQEQANKVQRGSVTSLRQQVNEARQARDAVAKYSDITGGLFGNVRQLSGEWVAQNQRVAALARQLDLASASGFWDRVKVGLNAQGLINFSNGLVQITQGLQAASIVIGSFISQINGLVTAVAKLESFKLSFVAAGAGGAGGLQALEEASRISLGLGANLGTVRDGFQRLTPVILNSGGSLTDVSAITEALSSRFAAFGLSADASRRVMNGVIQAFAKGKLQAEELTQQISEADPAFKTDFAGALGVTVSKLEELVKNGEITTDVLLSTLPALTKASLLYGKLGTSAASAVNSLDRSNLKLGEVGVTTEQVRTQLDSLGQLNFERLAISLQPLINSFLRIQAVVVDFFTYITRLQGTAALGQVFGSLGDVIANLLQGLASLAGVVATVVSPILQLIAVFLKIPGVTELISAVIAAKLLVSLKALPAAIVSSFAGFQTLGVKLLEAAQKYLGLGVAAKKAAVDVATSQAKINAAQAGGQVGGTLASYLPADQLKKTAQATTAVGAASAATAKGNAALNQALESTTAAAASAGPKVTSLGAVTGILAIATINIADAMQNYDAIMTKSNQTNEKGKAIIEDLVRAELELNKSLKGTDKATKETVNSWDASIERVGTYRTGIDRVIAALRVIPGLNGLVTNEEASLTQQTIALTDVSTKFGVQLDGLIVKYNKIRQQSKGTSEDQAKEKAAREALGQVISSRITQLRTQLAEEQRLGDATKEARAEKALNIQLIRVEIATLEAQQKAYGLLSEEQKSQAELTKQIASEIKTIADAEIQNLRTKKDAIAAAYDIEIEKVNAAKDALQSKRDLESAAANERIRQLRQLTPAEQELENIRIARLQQKAAGGDLEAKAQLERIANNKEIARIEEEERKKAAAAKQEERAIEQQLAALRLESKQKQSEIDKQITWLQNQVSEATKSAAEAAGKFTGQLKKGQTATEAILAKMKEIKDLAGQLRIPRLAGFRFTGGPVTGGSSYTVNELGREMFLSSSGKLSAINAKPWGTWRAPSSGTVIPAHIAAGLDIPSGKISAARLGSGTDSQNYRQSMRPTMNDSISMAIYQGVLRSMRDSGINQIGEVQAAQAMQIGKLGRAVDQLASKDWNVNVRVKNTGTAAYLEALNHRM